MFEEDLKEWRTVELEVAKRLIDSNTKHVEFAPDRKFTDWDFKITNYQWEEKSYEVKHDIVSDTSNNVGFEFSCNRKPSGIYISKADCIIYKLGDKYYCTDRARLLVWLTSYVKKRIKPWGDNKSALLYIVEKNDFIKFSKEI